jgi:hypothetical protein
VSPGGQAPGESSVSGGPAENIEFQRTHVLPALEKVEAAFGYPVISYYLDDRASLADEQMYHLYEHLRRTGPVERLGLWLYSRGGATEIPWKVISLLREFTRRLSILVPYRALSAGTLIALGGDEIVMTAMAELGPIDPSLRHPLLPTEEIATDAGKAQKKVGISISVKDLRHVLQFLEREIGKEKLTPDSAATLYTALFDKVHPLAIGALEQSWALSQQIGTQALGTHMDPKKEEAEIIQIVERLSDHYKSHQYQIGRGEARSIGLKVVDATAPQAEAMWALLLVYHGIQAGGEGEIGGRPAVLTRLGHIDSAGGSTIGLGITAKADQTIQGSNWVSSWAKEPLEAPASPA